MVCSFFSFIFIEWLFLISVLCLIPKQFTCAFYTCIKWSVIIHFTKTVGVKEGGKQRYQKARMCFSSAITSAFSCNVLCWLKDTLSFYMGDVRHNECGLMFDNLCSLTTGFDCLFNNKHP